MGFQTENSLKTWKNILLSVLQKRMDYLTDVIHIKKRSLRAAPEGRLCLSGSRGTGCYYRPAKGSPRIYLSQDEIALAYRLAQKEYDTEAVKAAQRELALEGNLAEFLEDETVDDLYGRFSAVRKRLICPLAPEPEVFVREWRSASFSRDDFREEEAAHDTENGEKVRSKSEVLIANTLYSHHIPYRYEYPLYLEGCGTVHPDFQVLNMRTGQEFFWEHFGMMDDPDYVETAVWKLRMYEMNGYYPGQNFIFTMETRRRPLNIKTIKGLIDIYFT